MAKNYKELSPEEAKSAVNLDVFTFQSTNEVKPRDKIINQERAESAMDFGLKIKSDGFNLFISGPTGTGRNTSLLRIVREIAKTEPVPDDICYLYNFDRPDEPKVLKLPCQQGRRFQDDMEGLIKIVKIEIQKAFDSKEYEEHKRMIIDDYESKKGALSDEFENFAKSKGIGIKQTITGIVLVPIYKDKELTESEYQKLSDQDKQEMNKRQDEVQAALDEFLRKVRILEREAREQIGELDKSIITYSIGHLIDDFKEKYKQYEGIKTHLGQIKQDILENLDSFKKEERKTEIPFLEEAFPEANILNRYKVNLLIDNSQLKGAPVIVEHTPTYVHLIGKIEHRARLGILFTDFTMIKPGSIHMANGGYLVIQAIDILRNYFAWDALKKVIKNKEVRIEDVSERFGLASTIAIRPQAVSVNFKVIVIGHPFVYYLLYMLDDDFRKLFKVKADFSPMMDKNQDSMNQYSWFVSMTSQKEKLLGFNKEAVGRIIEYSSRMVQDKDKLSAKFGEIVDILRESNYWAQKDGAGLVDKKHIDKAFEEKVYRSNMIEKRIQELIQENTLIIETEGESIGQLNGISVLDMGDYSFGMPSRITARTYLGRGQLINIEREAKLSGNIHSKGVLILNGYIGEKFGQNKPLALAASICFEQTYQEVEGDSASSAELYCLLSSLSELPLAQNIAVTGSVDQRGKIQPVGSINEKVEGFFAVCKTRGLSGKHGVIIPRQNVKNLVLKDEVIDAIRDKKFHVYPVETIDEGIEILTGVPAGRVQKDGTYPKATVYNKVDAKLRDYAHTLKTFTKTKGAKSR